MMKIKAEFGREVSSTHAVIIFRFLELEQLPEGEKYDGQIMQIDGTLYKVTEIGNRGIDFKEDGAYFSASQKISDVGYPAFKKMNKQRRAKVLKEIGEKAYREFLKLKEEEEKARTRTERKQERFEEIVI